MSFSLDILKSKHKFYSNVRRKQLNRLKCICLNTVKLKKRKRKSSESVEREEIGIKSLLTSFFSIRLIKHKVTQLANCNVTGRTDV